MSVNNDSRSCCKGFAFAGLAVASYVGCVGLSLVNTQSPTSTKTLIAAGLAFVSAASELAALYKCSQGNRLNHYFNNRKVLLTVIVLSALVNTGFTTYMPYYPKNNQYNEYKSEGTVAAIFLATLIAHAILYGSYVLPACLNDDNQDWKIESDERESKRINVYYRDGRVLAKNNDREWDVTRDVESLVSNLRSYGTQQPSYAQPAYAPPANPVIEEVD